MKRLLALACVSAGMFTASAQEVTLEYQVKAAYLFNFTKFVEWPSSTLGESAPFTICVAEMNPFGPSLSATIQGETVAGHVLVSRVVKDSPASCHILFVPRGVSIAPYLQPLRSVPVLTVGETADFLSQGGMISFVMEGGKIRFEINQDAAASAQLTISSRLLRLARNVG